MISGTCVPFLIYRLSREAKATLCRDSEEVTTVQPKRQWHQKILRFVVQCTELAGGKGQCDINVTRLTLFACMTRAVPKIHKTAALNACF